MTFNLKYQHGDCVLVIDQRGVVEARGAIAGRHDTRTGPQYDVQPQGEPSLVKRIVGLPESRIMLLGIPYPTCERVGHP